MTEAQKQIKFGKFLITGRVPSCEESVECFSAVQEGFDRPVELRILSPLYGENSLEYRRFVNEYKAFSLFDNKNIVKVFDGGKLNNRSYYVVPRREATACDNILAAGTKSFSPSEILSIAQDLAKALEHMHERGYLHLDGGIHSIAYCWEHEFAFFNSFRLGRKALSLSLSPAEVPLASYLAKTPELQLGKDVDCRTDLYLLGAFLYHLATLMSPFNDHFFSCDERGRKRLEPIAASSVSAELPRQLDSLLIKAMAREAEERFQSAKDFSEEAQKALRRMSIQDEVSKSKELSASSLRIEPDLIKQIQKKKKKRKKKEKTKKRAILDNIPKEESGLQSIANSLRETLSARPILALLPLLLFSLLSVFTLTFDGSSKHGSGSSGGGSQISSGGGENGSGENGSGGGENGSGEAGSGSGESGSAAAKAKSSSHKKAFSRVQQTYRKIKRNRTSKKTFQKRWENIQRWIKKIPQQDRKDKLFTYSTLVKVKLKFYSEPDEAAEELDKMYDKAAAYMGMDQ